MCGIPHHAANLYIEKLIEKGYKVGICEQLEDPKIAKRNCKTWNCSNYNFRNCDRY